MNKTHLRRSLAALGTAVACVMILATPAAAVTYPNTTITGGQITLTKTGMTPEVIDLAGTGTSTCPSAAITVDFPTTTTVGVTALTVKSIRGFNGTTGTFLTVLTRGAGGNTNGTITGGTNVSSMRVAISAAIYGSGNFDATTCTVSTNPTTGTDYLPICQLSLLLHLGGTFTGISTSNTFSLTGSSVGNVVANTTCGAGPSYLLGSAGTVTSPITGHLA